MTTATFERSLGDVARDALDGPAGLASRLRRAWTRYLAYRLSLAELRSLTARELADVGLGDADLPRLAWDATKKN